MIVNQRIRLVVGANVRALREASGSSVDDCAEKVGVHRTYWYLLEKGKLNFTIDKLAKVATLFNVTVPDLLEDLGPRKSNSTSKRKELTGARRQV